MQKSMVMYDMAGLKYLPLLERWMYRDHAPATISAHGPVMSQYDTYRMVCPPQGMKQMFKQYGTYNWRVVNQWWHETPAEDCVSAISCAMPEEIRKAVWDDGDSQWKGSETVHPPVRVYLPIRPTNMFKGAGMTLYDSESIVRWVVAFKYPEGVSMEEGEDWYLNTCAPELVRQENLLMFFSSRVEEPKIGPFVRVSEMWYKDLNAWRDAMENDTAGMSMPTWANCKQFPFLAPYKDFVGIFLSESPECNLLRDLGPYVCTS